MTGEKFFEIYNFEYHDGRVFDFHFENNNMFLTVVRCPTSIKSKNDENSLFQRLKFKNVSDIWLWNEEKDYSLDTPWEDMWKPSSVEEVEKEFKNGSNCWIDDAFFENGRIVYSYLLRFKCDDIEILESRTNPEYC